MMTDLKSCPFCGYMPHDTPRSGLMGLYVWCDECEALVIGETLEAAIAAWNTRHLTPVEAAAGAMLEALEATLAALEAFGVEANWGASCLSAATIRKVNEAPFQARAAIALATGALASAPSSGATHET